MINRKVAVIFSRVLGVGPVAGSVSNCGASSGNLAETQPQNQYSTEVTVCQAEVLEKFSER